MTNGRKRLLSWGQNLAICLLTVSALVLIGQSSLYMGFDAFVLAKDEGQPEGGRLGELVGVQSNMTAGPLRLLVQNSAGRYGVQYDREAMEALFHQKLGSLLREALTGLEASAPISEEVWRGAFLPGKTFIYYEFFHGLPLGEAASVLGGGRDGNLREEVAKRFCILEEGEGLALLYQNQRDGLYYRASQSGSSLRSLEEQIDQVSPNGAVFAFELPELYAALDPYQVILPTAPQLPVYEGKNPLEGINQEAWEDLLRSLAFNPRAVSTYESADGQVIRDGLDTLRVAQNGQLNFTAGSLSNPRYPVGESPFAGVRQILASVLAGQSGEGDLTFWGMSPGGEGEITITCWYALSGAPVLLTPHGYAARFVVKEGCVAEYTITLRAYTATQEQAAALPEVQASAAVSALHQTGSELIFCYSDAGDALRVLPNWLAY